MVIGLIVICKLKSRSGNLTLYILAGVEYMTTARIQKINFIDTKVLQTHMDKLKWALLSCAEVFESEELMLVDSQYAKRGITYYRMLKSFLCDPCFRRMIDEPLAKCIARDLQHLVKEFEYRGRRYLKMNIQQPYTRIKIPRLPFALLTFKCRLPRSNWYGRKNRSGRTKPSLLSSAINMKLREMNIPYSSFAEYSLENIAPNGGADWRSILHFHVVIPFISLKDDAEMPRVSQITNLMFSDDVTSRDLVIDQISNFMELSHLPDLNELETWWFKVCGDMDLEPIDVHRQDKIEAGEVSVDQDGYGLLEQNRGDWERMDKYSKKDKFLLWNIDQPKTSLTYRGRHGELNWQLVTNFGKVYHHSISPKLLMDHYRNVKVALPQRSRHSFAVHSHPLHKLLCRWIPFEVSNELYRKLLAKKDDIANMFNF
jgi:hypothetical protein